MKSTIYRQCEVRRGAAIRLTWIPAEYAVKGRVLRLRDNGEWSDGWVVREVYPDTERIIAPSPQGEIRRHRRATGDSLPRLQK
jgi:hypothetical protein